jgi:hypothetical protein
MFKTLYRHKTSDVVGSSVQSLSTRLVRKLSLGTGVPAASWA